MTGVSGLLQRRHDRVDEGVRLGQLLTFCSCAVYFLRVATQKGETL